MKTVFLDNLISSVNTHPTDAGFHGINEAASCADAREIAFPYCLTPPPPPSPEIILAKAMSFTTCHLLI